MRVSLNRLDPPFHFIARNDAGKEIHLDTGIGEGGTGKGVGPMQAVVMALGGCSAIDIALILSKGRQEVEGFDIEIDYERATDQTPALFTGIHAHYVLTGDLHVGRVRRAVAMSLDKYCSVAKILEKTARITASFSINGTRYNLNEDDD